MFLFTPIIYGLTWCSIITFRLACLVLFSNTKTIQFPNVVHAIQCSSFRLQNSNLVTFSFALKHYKTACGPIHEYTRRFSSMTFLCSVLILMLPCDRYLPFFPSYSRSPLREQTCPPPPFPYLIKVQFVRIDRCPPSIRPRYNAFDPPPLALYAVQAQSGRTRRYYTCMECIVV